MCYTKSSVLVHLPSRALRVACFFGSRDAQAVRVVMSLSPQSLHLLRTLQPQPPQGWDLITCTSQSLISSSCWDPCTITSLWGGFNTLWIRLTSDKRLEGDKACKSIWLRLLLRLHTTRESTLFSWSLWPAGQCSSGRCLPFFLFSFPSSLTLLPWIACPVINSLSKELSLGQSSSSNCSHVHPFAYPRNCGIHCFPKMTSPTLLHFLWEKNQQTDSSVIGYCLVTALSKLNS